MPDNFTYTLGLNPAGFVQGAKEAQLAERQLTDTIRAGSRDAATAQAQMTAAIREAAREAQEAQRNLTWQFRQGARFRADSLTAEMTAFRASNKTVADAAEGHDKMARSGRNSALAMLELSRAVEDAQYGLGGIINNVPTL